MRFLSSNSSDPAIETAAHRIGRKTIGLSHPKRAGRGIVVGTAVASLAVAGALAASASAASASTARSVGTLASCSWQPLSLINGWRSEQSVYDSGNPSYCVTSDGMVYLSGSLAQPGGESMGVLEELPVGPGAALTGRGIPDEYRVVGTVLGGAGISIHSMALEPTSQSNTALMVLSVNSAVPDEVVAALAESSGILGVDRVSL